MKKEGKKKRKCEEMMDKKWREKERKENSLTFRVRDWAAGEARYTVGNCTGTKGNL